MILVHISAWFRMDLQKSNTIFYSEMLFYLKLSIVKV